MLLDLLHTLENLKSRAGQYQFYSLTQLEAQGFTSLARLPFSIRILLEMVLRKCNGKDILAQDVLALAAWKPVDNKRPVIPFYPGRVVMQDFTGVPVIVDLAAMRAAAARAGQNPLKINPIIPVDLVIDHSVQVDYSGIPEAFRRNAELEFQRNQERYEFLHWAQKAFTNMRIVPPASGIVHQVNLEYLTRLVLEKATGGLHLAFPETLVGTDSHTTMINGLGVVGWGVGGIEAIAAMLGQPIEIVTPDVLGFKLSGQLQPGVTPTDLTLTVVQMLRKKGVVNKFVEFYGQGVSELSLADRAMIANMTPESGATITFFPVDDQTLQYLQITGREDLVPLVEAYYKEQGLFRNAETIDPEFSDTLELDISLVEPSMAGPKRPQDRVPLRNAKNEFHSALALPKTQRGFGLTEEQRLHKAQVRLNGETYTLGQGAIVIAAITSCTNTSDPSVMIAAGILARNAIKHGLKVQPFVKTSLAPGSRVVIEYLKKSGLLEPLAKLGFDLVGYGCTTCIGNSGPLRHEVEEAIQSTGLVVSAVLSGNRNFEGRVHPLTQANYLASPPLVVAYALAGTVDIDLTRDPIGIASDGKPVFLEEIWPSPQEIDQVAAKTITPELFNLTYQSILTGNETWNRIQSGDSFLYHWQPSSTYIQEPPYFLDPDLQKPRGEEISGARALVVLGDSVTTDHISPAGDIPSKSVAGKYLIEQGVPVQEFNSFGSRRGNDRVMTRGTFGNIRLKNALMPGVEGSQTLFLPTGEQMTIYEAAMRYRSANIPLVVLAGREYGTGSSRDWAAKGVLLLGVKAILAESFERIHRSNLAGMGVLPLQFKDGDSVKSLGLTGKETFYIEEFKVGMMPRSELNVRAVGEDGKEIQFKVVARLDTPIDVRYYLKKGLLPVILDELLQ